MLSAAHRLRSSRAFAEAIRHGSRAGSATLVLHLQPGSAVPTPSVGFVVSKAVGNAVTRNQVKRRLRHIARKRLRSLPGSAVLVVRALPAAAQADFGVLERDFDSVLGRVLARRTAGRPA